jgi:glycogen debranching enzyme
LRWPLPPSTSPVELRFHPRSYWRGPTWPVINWLLWWSLLRAGEGERAERLRRISTRVSLWARPASPGPPPLP